MIFLFEIQQFHLRHEFQEALQNISASVWSSIYQYYFFTYCFYICFTSSRYSCIYHQTRQPTDSHRSDSRVLKTLSYSFEGWCLYFIYFYLHWNRFFSFDIFSFIHHISYRFVHICGAAAINILICSIILAETERSTISLFFAGYLLCNKHRNPRLVLLNPVYSFFSFSFHSTLSAFFSHFSLSSTSSIFYLLLLFLSFYFILSPLILTSAHTFDLNIDAIEKVITLKTRAIIIHSSYTPSGKIYSEATLVRLSVMLIIELLLLFSPCKGYIYLACFFSMWWTLLSHLLRWKHIHTWRQSLFCDVLWWTVIFILLFSLYYYTMSLSLANILRGL